MNAQKVLQRSKVALEAQALPDLIRGQHCSFNGLVSLVWRSQTSRYMLSSLGRDGQRTCLPRFQKHQEFLERYSRRKWWGRRQCRRGRQKQRRDLAIAEELYQFWHQLTTCGIMPQLVSITVEESRSHWMLRGKMRN